MTVLLLGWCGWVMWRRRRRLALAERNGSCRVCGTPFAEAQIDYLGGLSRAEKAKLDRFQTRFAAFRILCLECGSVNVCTHEGVAFKATPVREGV